MADIYGELISAQLENLAADPTNLIGKIYYNTTSNRATYFNNTAWLEVASLTGTETLTNKSLTTPTILTGVVDDYIDVNEEAVPGTPAAGKVRVYAKTDAKLYRKTDTGDEFELGGGGGEGVNYVDNGSFEDGVTAGVTENTFTSVEETGTPIAGIRSHKLTSSGAVEACDYSLTIDPLIVEGGFFLTFSGFFKTDGAPATGDWTVGIYNFTDSVYVETATDLVASSTQRVRVGFVPLTGKTYVVRVTHIATAGRVLIVDRLKVSYEPAPSTPIVGPWVDAGAINFSTTGAALAKGTAQVDKFSYVRIGEMMHATVEYKQNTGGTAGTGRNIVNIPAGLTINTAKLGETAFAGFGGVQTLGHGRVGSSDGQAILNLYHDSGGIGASVFPDGTGTTGDWDFDTHDFASGFLRISFQFSVPITEWAAEGTTLTTADVTQKTKEFDLQVSALSIGAPANNYFAKAIAFTDSTGRWYADVSLHLEYTGTTSAFTFQLDGLDIDNLGGTLPGGLDYAFIGRHLGGAAPAPQANMTVSLPNTINVDSQAVARSVLVFEHRFRLASKPTWADANLENVLDASVTVAEATPNTGLGLVQVETDTYNLDNNFSAGDIKVSKIGNLVTINFSTGVTHSNLSIPVTFAILPTKYRPPQLMFNIITFEAGYIAACHVDTAGAITIIYRDWAGALVPRTTLGNPGSISYVVN